MKILFLGKNSELISYKKCQKLKNGIELTGVLTYVDNNMNFHITNVSVTDVEKYP